MMSPQRLNGIAGKQVSVTATSRELNEDKLQISKRCCSMSFWYFVKVKKKKKFDTEWVKGQVHDQIFLKLNFFSFFFF